MVSHVIYLRKTSAHRTLAAAEAGNVQTNQPQPSTASQLEDTSHSADTQKRATAKDAAVEVEDWEEIDLGGEELVGEEFVFV